MSIQAMVWALEDAPDVPPNLVTTLLGLANHADPDGCGAYPTIDRLAHYTRKGTRQVKDDLKRLRDLKLITEGDQKLISHLDPRYRPTVYNLAMHRRRSKYVRVSAIHEQNPAPLTPPRDEPQATPDEPQATPDDPSGDVQARQGCTTAPSGVNCAAPKPSFEPPLKTLPPVAAGVDGPATTPQGRKKNPPTTKDQIADTVDQTRHHQPRWKKASVIAALQQVIADGLDPTVACTVMVQLAEGTVYGPTTAGPQRILARGPWWTPGEVFVAKSKDNAKPCPHHPGQPAHNCAGCAGESLGADGPAHPRDWKPAPTTPPKNIRDHLAKLGLRSNRTIPDGSLL